MVKLGRRFAFVLAAAAAAGFALAAGCATQPRIPGAAGVRAWPPPPEAPRIWLVGEFRGAEDLSLRRGPIGRVIDWIADPDERRLRHPYAVAVTGTVAGTGPGEDGAPGPAVIAVTDTDAHVVHVFDLEQREHRLLSEAGEDRRLAVPVGVAFDAERRIYVSDSGLAAVVRYRADGEFDRVLSSSFTRPAGVAVDAVRGRMYVADAPEHVVRVFDLEGTPIGLVPGEFRFPTHLSVARDGRLVVSDSLNFRVVVTRPDGSAPAAIGHLGDGSGDLQRPKGVALDSEDHLYVVDALFDNVQIFGLDGSFLLPFGSRGEEPGEMSIPAGIAIDDRDLIYVADTYNGRVQVFRYLKE